MPGQAQEGGDTALAWCPGREEMAAVRSWLGAEGGRWLQAVAPPHPSSLALIPLSWWHRHPTCLPRPLSQTCRQGHSQGQETPGTLGQSQAGDEADEQVQDEEQEVGKPPGWRRRDGRGSRAKLPPRGLNSSPLTPGPLTPCHNNCPEWRYGAEKGLLPVPKGKSCAHYFS